MRWSSFAIDMPVARRASLWNCEVRRWPVIEHLRMIARGEAEVSRARMERVSERLFGVREGAFSVDSQRFDCTDHSIMATAAAVRRSTRR